MNKAHKARKRVEIMGQYITLDMQFLTKQFDLCCYKYQKYQSLLCFKVSLVHAFTVVDSALQKCHQHCSLVIKFPLRNFYSTAQVAYIVHTNLACGRRLAVSCWQCEGSGYDWCCTMCNMDLPVPLPF